MSLEELELALRASWSADSCDPVDLAAWSSETPSTGQCAVTALVVQDHLGGELLIADVRHADGRRQGVHYWNRLPGGREIDLTRDQFRAGEVIGSPQVEQRPADTSRGRLVRQYARLSAAVSARVGEAVRMRGDLQLEPVTRENVDAVLGLTLRSDQEHLVGSAATTVAYAHYEPGSVLRAITIDGVPVGVLLVLCEEAVPYLVRFHVDADHQGQGIGRRAVELLLAELRDAGWDALETSYVPVEGGAAGFWERVGFAPTGRLHDGEPLVRRATG